MLVVEGKMYLGDDVVDEPAYIPAEYDAVELRDAIIHDGGILTKREREYCLSIIDNPSIRDADIAKKWGVSRAYLGNLKRSLRRKILMVLH